MTFVLDARALLIVCVFAQGEYNSLWRGEIKDISLNMYVALSIRRKKLFCKLANNNCIKVRKNIIILQHDDEQHGRQLANLRTVMQGYSK